MDWWTEVGNYLGFFDDTPALAVDMALYGPPASAVGYDLAFGLQAARTPIDIYPSEQPFADPGV